MIFPCTSPPNAIYAYIKVPKLDVAAGLNSQAARPRPDRSDRFGRWLHWCNFDSQPEHRSVNPSSSSRQHLSNDDCVDDKRVDYVVTVLKLIVITCSTGVHVCVVVTEQYGIRRLLFRHMEGIYRSSHHSIEKIQ